MKEKEKKDMIVEYGCENLKQILSDYIRQTLIELINKE